MGAVALVNLTATILLGPPGVRAAGRSGLPGVRAAGRSSLPGVRPPGVGPLKDYDAGCVSFALIGNPLRPGGRRSDA